MAQQRNPFDNAFELMKELQGQVADLSAALEGEKQSRAQEVADLKVALAQERAERTALHQQMNQNVESASQRLESAQDRIRFDMGDLRKALQKECDERAEGCAGISQALDAEARRLQSALDALHAAELAHYQELSAASEKTNREWSEAVRVLDAKVDEQTRQLGEGTAKVAEDLAAFSRASVTLEAGVQHGVGIIMESLRSFVQAGGANAGAGGQPC